MSRTFSIYSPFIHARIFRHPNRSPRPSPKPEHFPLAFLSNPFSPYSCLSAAFIFSLPSQKASCTGEDSERRKRKRFLLSDTASRDFRKKILTFPLKFATMEPWRLCASPSETTAARFTHRTVSFFVYHSHLYLVVATLCLIAST